MSTTPRVVVIEHDYATLEMFGELLQLEGFDPILHYHMKLKPEDIAASGAEVILLDWSVRNAGEACQFVEQVASYPATSTIPIIICTTESAHRIQQNDAWLNSRNVDVIYKPSGLDELIPMITRYVNTPSVS